MRSERTCARRGPRRTRAWRDAGAAGPSTGRARPRAAAAARAPRRRVIDPGLQGGAELVLLVDERADVVLDRDVVSHDATIARRSGPSRAADRPIDLPGTATPEDTGAWAPTRDGWLTSSLTPPTPTSRVGVVGRFCDQFAVYSRGARVNRVAYQVARIVSLTAAAGVTVSAACRPPPGHRVARRAHRRHRGPAAALPVARELDRLPAGDRDDEAARDRLRVSRRALRLRRRERPALAPRAAAPRRGPA